MTETSERGKERIVVGVDGSAASGEALRWALTQAARTGADIDAVACWHWPASASGYGYAPYVAFDNERAAGTQKAADAAAADAVAATKGTGDVVIRTRVLEGYPAKVLIEAAVGADLLVVGSRGHGELAGMLLGSVGLHCASHSPCPVVIIHPHLVDAAR